MMELEAAVIDGTRFLCYDDGATVPRRRPAYPDPNLRSNRACLPGRPSRLALHEALRKTISAARRKCFSQRLSS